MHPFTLLLKVVPHWEGEKEAIALFDIHWSRESFCSRSPEEEEEEER